MVALDNVAVRKVEAADYSGVSILMEPGATLRLDNAMQVHFPHFRVNGAKINGSSVRAARAAGIVLSGDGEATFGTGRGAGTTLVIR